MRSAAIFGAQTRRPASGFTLVEVLVVLLVLSVLLAVVIPVVSQQWAAAEAPRVAADLTSLRDAIAMFRAQVRKFPEDIEDLANLIDDSGLDKPLFGPSFYTTAERNRWKGPYIEAAVPELLGPGPAFRTGFDLEVLNLFNCFNADGDTVAIAGTDCPDSLAAGKPIFVAVKLFRFDLDTLDFLRINELIDGPNEPSPKTQGRLRHGNFAPLGDTVFYLALPISR